MKVRIEFEFEQSEGQVNSIIDKANGLFENIKALATIEAKPATRRRTTNSETAAPAPAPAAPAAPAAPTTVTLQELRTLLSSKVAEHKAEIKTQLTQFGAGNLTTLPTEKYEAMYNYLKSLS